MPVPVPVPGSRRQIGSDPNVPFLEAFRASRTAMILTDARRPDYPIVFANQAFLTLTGYAEEEVAGCNCRFLQGPETDGATVRSIAEAMRAGEAVETEILNYRKDGSAFWNAVSIAPVRNDAGETIYFFATQVDVSEGKRIEAELERRVEAEVRRRTADLQAAADRAAALLQEVDHRAKNSLQMVSSLVLLKARRLQNPEARDALQGLAERIGALSAVYRLLHPADESDRFDLRDFLTDLLSDIAASLPSGQIGLEVEVEPVGIAARQAVPVALLVYELVADVLKRAAPDAGAMRLSVRAARQGRQLSLAVQDDGVAAGAPPEESFEKTLIDTLVRQLRARIAWDDAPSGTRVTVTMPLDTEEMSL